MTSGITRFRLLFVATLLLPAVSAWADGVLGSHVVEENGKTLVVISNAYEELTFEPARGGRCVQFRFLDNNEQLIGKDDVSGMFIDHWAKYPWPSAVMGLPYEARIVGDGKTKVGLLLQVTVPATGGGKGEKEPTSPDLIGLVVRKTVWLQADNDAIVVDQEIRNPTAESRAVALYIQHTLSLGGSRHRDSWYMPSGRGVVVNLQPDVEGGRTIGPDWVKDPTAGWMAVRDRATDRGLLFAFDYNYVQKLYTCGSSAEWFMEAVPVGPGKDFAFQYIIKPVKGFQDFVHASRNLVADIRGKDVGKKVAVTLDLAAVIRPLRDVTVTATVTGWRSKEKLATETFTLEQAGNDKIRKTFQFGCKSVTDGVVIRVVAKGADFQETFEHYYAGDKYEHERRYGWFATKGGALAGAKGDAYALTPPRKVKHIDKPDLTKVARPAADHFKCLVVFGLFTQILNIDDALTGWKSKGGAAPEFTWANCPPNAIETFPGTYDELFRHDVVVLSDVNYKAIGAIGFEMLSDYVEQGGNLVVTGGPYAFGNGEFEEGERFLEVLPAGLLGPFDLKWAGKGKSWDLEPALKDSPLLKGVSFDDKPKVFWRHEVTPKPGTEVVLTSGGKPTLVVGKYGKGKVAMLTLSPTGVENAGETAWWSWKGWSPLVQNVFTWFESK